MERSDVSMQVTIDADDQVTELHSQLAAAHLLWDDQKRSVLAAVECVKTLVAQIQVQTIEFCCV